MNTRHVVTDRVRLSYEHIMRPYARNQGDEPKYSVTILLPKSDIATKTRIDTAIEAAKQEGAGAWGGVIPPVLAIPVYDGDGVRPSDGMPFGAECRGCWVFTASSKQAPQVVDTGLNPIISETEIYSGIYARVSIDFFPYNSNGKKGIGCALGNVQKLADGEPLGNRVSAEDDFGGSAAAAPYQQAQTPYQAQYQPAPATAPYQVQPTAAPQQYPYQAQYQSAPATAPYQVQPTAAPQQYPYQQNPIPGM